MLEYWDQSRILQDFHSSHVQASPTNFRSRKDGTINQKDCITRSNEFKGTHRTGWSGTCYNHIPVSTLQRQQISSGPHDFLQDIISRNGKQRSILPAALKPASTRN